VVSSAEGVEGRLTEALDLALAAQTGEAAHLAAWGPGGALCIASFAGRDPGKLRIGRYAAPVIADSEIHPDCLAAYEAATAALTDLADRKVIGRVVAIL